MSAKLSSAAGGVQYAAEDSPPPHCSQPHLVPIPAIQALAIGGSVAQFHAARYPGSLRWRWEQSEPRATAWLCQPISIDDYGGVTAKAVPDGNGARSVSRSGA